MERLILQCIEDMQNIVSEGKFSLESQVRAYDLLESLIDLYGDVQIPDVLTEAAARFCSLYEENAGILSSSFDASVLMKEAEERLRPLEESCNEARFEAAAAASLHEFAKEVFDIWQNSGVFARRRALKELRDRAGFRLESHRIGNYVAKTFDLQNVAAARFAECQQALYKANVAYKIKKDVYALIAERLSL
jgi:hypothetical protein